MFCPNYFTYNCNLIYIYKNKIRTYFKMEHIPEKIPRNEPYILINLRISNEYCTRKYGTKYNNLYSTVLHNVSLWYIIEWFYKYWLIKFISGYVHVRNYELLISSSQPSYIIILSIYFNISYKYCASFFSLWFKNK
jgi:hypothetical protein